MGRVDHFALLVTINRYPGLSDLQGPENDGLLFKQWLLDPLGGDVDASQVLHICSSDFGAMKDPYDANPTERQLVRALDGWMRTPERGWKDKVGTRLYLYFAGHGFTAGSSISDPALFSAVAQNGDPAHIAGYRYAAKIANAGFFDEIVLVMDCCQDVLKASQVLEPTWSPPDRNQAANTKLLQAYGAPRGRKAFERALTEGAPPHGLFSSAWIEALRNALPDDKGWVTGQAVKNQLLQMWGQRYRAEVSYDPPVRLPDGEDIRLFQRKPAAGGGGAAAAGVGVDVSALVARGATVRARRGKAPAPRRIARMRGSTGGAMAAPLVPGWVDLDTATGAPVPLWPGLYSIEARDGGPDLAFEVLSAGAPQPVPLPAAPAPQDDAPRSASVALSTPDAGADLVVVDANFGVVGKGVGRLSLVLADGLYKAQARAVGAVSESLFRVQGAPLNIELPPVVFASAAPLPGTTGADHGLRGLVARVSTGPAAVAWAGAAGAELFVCVRGGGSSSLRLVALQGGADHVVFEGGAVPACAKVALGGGTHALLQTVNGVGRSDEYGLAVATAPGWRTEVYLEGLDDAQAFDFAAAAIWMVPLGADSLVADALGRATELARLRLAGGRPVDAPSPEDAARSPMLALFAEAGAGAGGVAGVPDALRTGAVPLLASAWAREAIDPRAVAAIGQWRLGGSVWTVWKQPQALAAGLRRALQQPGADDGPDAPELPWSRDDWQAAAPGLRVPDPLLSPCQQALRRRVLDALADGEDWPAPEEALRLAQRFGLTPRQAARACAELLALARRS